MEGSLPLPAHARIFSNAKLSRYQDTADIDRKYDSLALSIRIVIGGPS